MEEKEPSISIIIPNYNRADLIHETLTSIQAQSYLNWECLIVDDGSTDNSKEAIKRFTATDNRFKFLERPKVMFKGANACRNYGLKQSRGDCILFFDSDDIMHPEKLKRQKESLQENASDLSICKSQEFKLLAENSIGYRLEHLTTTNLFEDYLTKRLVIPICSVLINKNLLLEYDLKFNTQLKAAQEWEFFSHLFANHPKFSFIDDTLDYIRRHNKSISGKKDVTVYWNYTYARHLIFQNYRTKVSDEVYNYFGSYFARMFRLFLRHSANDKAFFLLKTYLLKHKKFSFFQKLNMLLGLVSYATFNRGNYFLKKTKN